MNTAWCVSIAALAAILPAAAPQPGVDKAARLADLAGAWSGSMTHEGESQPLAFEFEPGDDGKILIKATIPVVHFAHTPIGRAPLEVEGDQVRIGPLALRYDAKAGTLSGTMPEGFVPVYQVPFTLRRVERIEAPARQASSAPLAKPVWTFDAGAPLWPGASYADGVVYAGAEDGRLHALDARTGKPRWSFRAGGPIRARATVSGGDVWLQADDGFAYKLAAGSGEERWRVRVAEKPIVRLPFSDPKSRFDRFGSEVVAADGRLFLGTHDGKLLALDPARGAKLWEFNSGDSVLAAPAIRAGSVYFGSYDNHVYALAAADGRLLWKRDTHKPVVSTPAVTADGLRLVIGSRSYDLLGLDAATGDQAWKRYVWFSWVESSASIRDGVAYVGSSDAASVSAVDAHSGARVWSADVYGWAWGQPAVTPDVVYVGVASQKGYMANHQGGVMALERLTGRPRWRFQAEPPESGAYGFPGSPAAGAGLVFATGLDGRVYAFAE